MRVAVMRSWQMRPGRVRELKGRGTSVVRNHYQATASKDSEDFMCAVAIAIFGVCNTI
jgi:hypothetical protein